MAKDRPVVHDFLKEVDDVTLNGWVSYTSDAMHAFILSRMQKFVRNISHQMLHPPNGQSFNAETLCMAQGRVSGLEEYGKFFEAVKNESIKRRDSATAGETDRE